MDIGKELAIAFTMKRKKYQYVMLLEDYDPLYVPSIAVLCSLLKHDFKDYKNLAVLTIDKFITYLEGDKL